jgi:hypothetical protein
MILVCPGDSLRVSRGRGDSLFARNPLDWTVTVMEMSEDFPAFYFDFIEESQHDSCELTCLLKAYRQHLQPLAYATLAPRTSKEIFQE